MTREDLIKLAQEAGLVRAGDKWVEPARWGVAELVHFAALVAAAEREACARVCESHRVDGQLVHSNAVAGCAAAIRARGNT